MQEFRVTLRGQGNGKVQFDIEGVVGRTCGPIAQAILDSGREIAHGDKPEAEAEVVVVPREAERAFE